jgi:hypothetical protein
MDKFSHLPNPIADHYSNWEAAAIEKCRNDPSIRAANLCPVCMIDLPVCHCVNRCYKCGKPFGKYACQCPGRFTSAYDKDGNKLDGCHPSVRGLGN